jgi:2-aminoadipate transaminase
LAGQLGLNRTTISAAYELLEAEGLIAGQVGRGSFVTGGEKEPAARPRAVPGQTVNWGTLLDRGDSFATMGAAMGREISFVMSRPSRDLFPLDDSGRAAKRY